MKTFLSILIIIISSISSLCSQVKPIADTTAIQNGGITKINVLSNDGTGKMLITKFMVKTSNVAVGQVYVISGVGTVKIDSFGLLELTANKAFIGKWPSISYTINNKSTLTAKVVIVAAPSFPNTLSSFTTQEDEYLTKNWFRFGNNQIALLYNGTYRTGNVIGVLQPDGTTKCYACFIDNNAVPISLTLYNWLTFKQ